LALQVPVMWVHASLAISKKKKIDKDKRGAPYPVVFPFLSNGGYSMDKSINLSLRTRDFTVFPSRKVVIWKFAIEHRVLFSTASF
jgi:hypothetical protein